MIRMNILDGPIYFNCCPNYSVDLNDPLIIDILLSDIHLPNIPKKKEPWIVNTLLLEIHLPNIEKNSHPI